MSDDDRRFIRAYNVRRRASAASVWMGLIGLFLAPTTTGALRAAGWALIAAYAVINLGLCRCPACGRLLGPLPPIFAAGGRKPACERERAHGEELDLPD